MGVRCSGYEDFCRKGDHSHLRQAHDYPPRNCRTQTWSLPQVDVQALYGCGVSHRCIPPPHCLMLTHLTGMMAAIPYLVITGCWTISTLMAWKIELCASPHQNGIEAASPTPRTSSNIRLFLLSVAFLAIDMFRSPRIIVPLCTSSPMCPSSHAALSLVAVLPLLLLLPLRCFVSCGHCAVVSVTVLPHPL